MGPTFTKTGGARIGWVNATWPLAQILVTPNELVIKVRLLGTYQFTPEQVISLERYRRVLSSGIRINHQVADYPQRILFLSPGNLETILKGIGDAGFIPTASPLTIPARQGIPMRWSAIIVAIVIWNALFLLVSPPHANTPQPPNGFLLLPLFIAFTFSLGTLASAKLQSLILKPGRRVGEIQPFLRLLAFVTGLLLIIFSILLATGTFNQQGMRNVQSGHAVTE